MRSSKILRQHLNKALAQTQVLAPILNSLNNGPSPAREEDLKS